MTSEQPALILASASPRRRELLGYFDLAFLAVATDAEEQDRMPEANLLDLLPPVDVPLSTHPALLAWRKASAACTEYPGSVIIGADTIVVLDGDVLGKPTDPAHARAMLRRLAGRTHTVYTGVVTIDTHAQPRFDAVASAVTLATLTDAVIAEYVATGEPMDKAGSYGIQGLGGRLVESVAGSYTNVVGLPLEATCRLLAAAGVRCPVDPSDAYRRWLCAQGKEPLPCPPTFP